MNPLRTSTVLIALLLAGFAACAQAPAPPLPASTTVKTLFRKPPRIYSTGPLWVWNDMLTDEEIRGTLRDLASQNVKQVWVHPRPGLMTPYLSPEWFRLWKVALDEARRLDMNVWIYDENSYPSGFAGGFVPDAMPESRGRGLVFRETKTAPEWATETLGVYALDEGSSKSVSKQIKSGERLPEARYLVVSEARAGNSPWHGNRCYVNLLSPGVTEKFLELTFEPYRLQIGGEFGKRVPGAFTDEPNIHPAGDLPWSEILAQEFQKRWGYDLVEHLPSLRQPVGDWRRIRHNYFQVLNEQFIEHWSRPYHDYCERNHLAWTGHYWDHEWPNCVGVPDNMAMYAWHQWPAIDCLMNQYAENTHAQFGNLRMVRELDSVANQLGMRRTLCEVYGAGGWDLRFEDMKRIADWLEVLGVNTLNQHLSYVTIRGARKRDHPQSFSYHEPWWDAYHVSAQYLARLSAALSQGEQVNRVLVLEPTTTAWMYQGDSARLNQIGDSFFKLLQALDAAQVEYDIGSEDISQRHGGPGVVQKLADGKETTAGLKIGRREYHTIIIPPLTENLNRTTKDLLSRVSITRCAPAGEPPRVDGVLDSSATAWVGASDANWLEQFLARERERQLKDGFWIDRAPGDQGILFHNRRLFADGQLLFLVNSSIEHPSRGVLHSSLAGAETWDLYTGQIKAYPCSPSGQGISVPFDLPPSGSLLLFLGKKPTRAELTPEIVSRIKPAGAIAVKRLQPNVLTLDYVDATAQGETRTNLYFYQANQFVWKQNGMERNPWDSAVQFKDELISKKFPAGSGFEARYRFNIAGPVPANLAIVVERPDLYRVTCNGQPLHWNGTNWWLDKAFGRMLIASAARAGENVVTIQASPFTMYHELEPAYVLGDFTLKAGDRGFTIEPDAPLELAACGWNSEGHPFYSGGVAYQQRFEVDRKRGQYRVSLLKWRGSVAEVKVNGRRAGYIDAPPWECDVTAQIKTGANEVEVVVLGTLKNTLGPHHGRPALGAAWPGSFQHGPQSGPPPGNEYSTVAYGLFEPFVLSAVTR